MSGFSLARSLAVAAVASSGLWLSAERTEAAIAFTSCVGTGYNISNKVTDALDCTISDLGSQGYNFALDVINQEPGFFGIQDWVFAAAGGVIGSDGAVTGGDNISKGLSGNFILNAALFAGNKVMAVFNDGGGTTLVGYLLSGPNVNWSTPFLNPPFTGMSGGGSTGKDVSGIRIYTSEVDTTQFEVVPLPAAAWLLLGGLGGLGMVARRRKSAEA